MFDVFGSLKSVAKIDSVCIDNNVFRLHYKVTVIFLFASSLLVSSSQYFGDPIDCIQNDDIPENVIDTYCWIHATFVLPQAFDKKIGIDVPHAGVIKSEVGQQRVYQKYYQWVCFVLFLQAILFYTPRYLWKLWEGGRLRSLVCDLRCPVLQEEQRAQQIDMLVHYLKLNRKKNNSYFFYFVFCELFNFINVFAQIYLIDAFLGGVFLTYGLDVLKFTETDQEYRADPMVKRFPRMTKCTFHRFGSSGDVQRHDALCILSLNIINEKIYIFLWFWLVFLAFVTTLILIYRFFVIFFPKLRLKLLKNKARFVDKNNLQELLQVTDLGDWFLLMQIGKNIDAINYREILEKLRLSLRYSSEDSELKPLKPYEAAKS